MLLGSRKSEKIMILVTLLFLKHSSAVTTFARHTPRLTSHPSPIDQHIAVRAHRARWEITPSARLPERSQGTPSSVISWVNIFLGENGPVERREEDSCSAYQRPGEKLSKQSFCRTLRSNSAVKTWSPGPKPFFRFCTHRSIRASGRACNMFCKSLNFAEVDFGPASFTWGSAGSVSASVSSWPIEGPRIRVTRNRSSLRSSSWPESSYILSLLKHLEPV